MKKWLSAFRLQTLPLAFSTILMGAAIAAFNGYSNNLALLLAFSTATFLQILSNLANDYGDALSGVDNANRLGPVRAIQSGKVSVQEMKVAVVVFTILSLVSGTALLFSAFEVFSQSFVAWFIVGVLSIAAAIKYTVGKNAYGYSGLGDISVFVFFGLVGVFGSYYLISNSLFILVFLPAVSMGCFAVGVLNLNNLRDIENDAKHGKNTLVVLKGKNWGKTYHYTLLAVGWSCFLAFLLIEGIGVMGYLPFLSLPIFILNVQSVRHHTNPKELIAKLKQLALGTFVFALLFFFSSLLS